MKLSELNDLFESRIDINQFKIKIDDEISEYKRRIKKRGVNLSINLEQDINNFKVKKKDLIFLSENYLDNKIDQWELNYIAEGLVFATYDNIKDSDIQSALDLLTDPEYEQLVNLNFIKRIVKDLKSN